MASNRTRRNRPRNDENREESTRGGQQRYEGEYRAEFNREYEPGNGGSRYREDYEERRGRRNVVKRAAGAVGDKVGGMDLDKALVLLHTALALAIVIKQTRARGSNRPRKAEPFRSAMSVLNYYLNEGRELSEMQRATLEDIKEELRMLYNREDEMMSPAAE